MNSNNLIKIILLSIFSLVFLMVMVFSVNVEANFPERSPVFNIHTQPGGGADLFFRNVFRIAQENDITIDGYSFEIRNRPGGSGIVCYSYIYGSEGDPYELMPAQMSLITRLLTEDVGFNWSDFTLIANLVDDIKILSVNADSDYFIVDDIQEAANNQGITIGGGFMGASDSIVGFDLRNALEGDVEYLPFGDTPDAVAALLGEDIDVFVGNPMETMSLYEAGRIRYIGVVSTNRNPSLPDVPTLSEQGYDVTIAPNRGIAAPGNIPEEARVKLEQFFKEVVETDDWNDLIMEGALVPHFLGTEDFEEYFRNNEETLIPIMEEMDLL